MHQLVKIKEISQIYQNVFRKEEDNLVKKGIQSIHI